MGKSHKVTTLTDAQRDEKKQRGKSHKVTLTEAQGDKEKRRGKSHKVTNLTHREMGKSEESSRD